jgi:hypothetical protein
MALFDANLLSAQRGRACPRAGRHARTSKEVLRTGRSQACTRRGAAWSGDSWSPDPVVKAAPRVREKRSLLAKPEQTLLVRGSQAGHASS